MPRRKKTNGENGTTGTPENSNPRATAAMKEYRKNAIAVRDGLTSLHLTNVFGDSVECPTGNPDECDKCKVITSLETEITNAENRFQF
jgi:hypothetical protein